MPRQLHRSLRLRMLEFWTLALFGGQVVAAQTGHMPINGSGSSACPCVNPWAQQPQKECHNATWPSGAKICQDSNYGASSCQMFDRASDACSKMSSPAARRASGMGWCDSAWCYINTSHCDRPYSGTSLAFDPPPAGILAYSYVTCGNLDNYGQSKHLQALAGKTLRVSYPGDSGSGYTIKTVSEKRGWYAGPNRQVDGSVVAFMHSVAARVGFQLQFHPVSAESKEQVRDRCNQRPCEGTWETCPVAGAQNIGQQLEFYCMCP